MILKLLKKSAAITHEVTSYYSTLNATPATLSLFLAPLFPFSFQHIATVTSRFSFHFPTLTSVLNSRLKTPLRPGTFCHSHSFFVAALDQLASWKNSASAWKGAVAAYEGTADAYEGAADDAEAVAAAALALEKVVDEQKTAATAAIQFAAVVMMIIVMSSIVVAAIDAG